MGIKDFISEKMSKDVDFMGKKVKIFKLTYGQVSQIQDAVKAAAEAADNGGETDELAVLMMAIQFGVEGGAELTAEDIKSFPLDELNKLTDQVMKFSGLGVKTEGKSA